MTALPRPRPVYKPVGARPQPIGDGCPYYITIRRDDDAWLVMLTERERRVREWRHASAQDAADRVLSLLSGGHVIRTPDEWRVLFDTAAAEVQQRRAS